MKPKTTVNLTASLLLAAAPPALGDWSAAGPPRMTLPVELVETLDTAKFKIRVPANWNGTLLVYLQGARTGAPPPEPLLVPPVLSGSQPRLEETLLSQGYGLAASEIAATDMQLKESVEDHLALTSYFRGRVGDPKRVFCGALPMAPWPPCGSSRSFLAPSTPPSPPAPRLPECRGIWIAGSISPWRMRRYLAGPRRPGDPSAT
jgi:hypothetical protein